eukprot:scaffold662_cov364-Pavlova_lutheri.AAC.48
MTPAFPLRLYPHSIRLGDIQPGPVWKRYVHPREVCDLGKDPIGWPLRSMWSGRSMKSMGRWDCHTLIYSIGVSVVSGKQSGRLLCVGLVSLRETGRSRQPEWSEHMQSNLEPNW